MTTEEQEQDFPRDDASLWAEKRGDQWYVAYMRHENYGAHSVEVDRSTPISEEKAMAIRAWAGRFRW